MFLWTSQTFNFIFVYNIVIGSFDYYFFLQKIHAWLGFSDLKLMNFKTLFCEIVPILRSKFSKKRRNFFCITKL